MPLPLIITVFLPLITASSEIIWIVLTEPKARCTLRRRAEQGRHRAGQDSIGVVRTLRSSLSSCVVVFIMAVAKDYFENLSSESDSECPLMYTSTENLIYKSYLQFSYSNSLYSACNVSPYLVLICSSHTIRITSVIQHCLMVNSLYELLCGRHCEY